MKYINPIELLGLASTAADKINNAVIDHAKKELLAEIAATPHQQLSYNGDLLDADTCENVIAELDNPERRSYYHIIANDYTLNGFLITGDHLTTINFEGKYIYKDPSFIRFISPYFAAAYGQTLVQAYSLTNTNAFFKNISITPLVTKEDSALIYEPLVTLLQQHQTTLQQLLRDEASYQEDDLSSAILALINRDALNVFPRELEIEKADLLEAARNAAWQLKTLRPDSGLPGDLLHYLLQIKTPTVLRQQLEKDYEQITGEKAPEYSETAFENKEPTQDLVSLAASVAQPSSGPKTGWYIFTTILTVVLLAYRLTRFFNLLNVNEPPQKHNLNQPAGQFSSGVFDNQLANGAAPLDSCLQLKPTKGPCTFKVKNPLQEDAIVCLLRKGSHRTVLNTYIQSNTEYEISGIPAAEYEIYLILGRDWDTNLPSNHCPGGFRKSPRSVLLANTLSLMGTEAKVMSLDSVKVLKEM
ncbi:hypothetical protein [Chitinophaga flava]|uniref:Uncharacterized protein n=1 Tax=Chitinophaga flava TaxID=2259036 RepID=A0A365XT56_9BACT|nr:hypothetical protein [Chitinophaga flava]RBL89539.1 hypothetical protein DF182_23805 [Chitinophaga flava]